MSTEILNNLGAARLKVLKGILNEKRHMETENDMINYISVVFSIKVSDLREINVQQFDYIVKGLSSMNKNTNQELK